MVFGYSYKGFPVQLSQVDGAIRIAVLRYGELLTAVIPVCTLDEAKQAVVKLFPNL